MEMTMRLSNHKYLKAIICFILCLTTLCLTFYTQYQEVHAALPLIIIGGAALLGGLLVAAGITFATQEAQNTTVDWYYGEMRQSDKQKIFDVLESQAHLTPAEKKFARIDADLWNNTVTWVNDNFNPGINTITKKRFMCTVSEYIAVDQKTYSTELMVNYDIKNNFTVFPYGVMNPTIVGNTEIKFTSETKTVSDYTYVLTSLYVNDVKYGVEQTANPDYPFTPYLYINSSNSLVLAMRYVDWMRPEQGYKDGDWYTFAKEYGSPDSYALNPGLSGAQPQTVTATGQSVVDTQHEIVMTDGMTRAVRIVDKPEDLIGMTKNDVVVTEIVVPWSNTWEGSFRDCAIDGEFDFIGTGSAAIGKYAVGTWTGTWDQDIETGRRTWTGVYEDALANTWTGTASQVIDDTRTWWDSLVEGLAGTLQDIRDAIGDIAAPIVTAIAGAYAAVASAVQEGYADIQPKMGQFKIPDLFIIFLDILIACIALVVRACLYLATIVTIPADSSLLNSNAIAGLNLFRNQNIPVINVSVWNMFSGMMTLVISLSVVKKVRSTHS